MLNILVGLAMFVPPLVLGTLCVLLIGKLVKDLEEARILMVFLGLAAVMLGGFVSKFLMDLIAKLA